MQNRLVPHSYVVVESQMGGPHQGAMVSLYLLDGKETVKGPGTREARWGRLALTHPGERPWWLGQDSGSEDGESVQFCIFGEGGAHGSPVCSRGKRSRLTSRLLAWGTGRMELLLRQSSSVSACKLALKFLSGSGKIWASFFFFF